MSVSILYRIEGIPKAIQNLRNRQKHLEDFHDPLNLLVKDFFEVQRGWMNSEGRGSWKPLSAKYEKWKRNKVGSKLMLQFRGDLYDDVTGASSGGTSVSRGRATIRTVKSGSKWRWHTEGLSTNNKSGFARPRRRVLSPALQIRRQYWNKLLARWAAGEIF